jgi:dihydrolipoamide dehydrogenase
MNEKYEVAVIGSGSGGSEAALLAAQNGLKVIIIEKGAFGGTRLHLGCYAVRALRARVESFDKLPKASS